MYICVCIYIYTNGLLSLLTIYAKLAPLFSVTQAVPGVIENGSVTDVPSYCENA